MSSASNTDDAAGASQLRSRLLDRRRRGSQRVAGRREAAGASTDQVAAFRGAIAGIPGAFAAIRAEITPQNPMAEASPMAHALWMFVSNLFAGAVPVVPFALLPFQEARTLSVIVTTALLLALEHRT